MLKRQLNMEEAGQRGCRQGSDSRTRQVGDAGHQKAFDGWQTPFAFG
jgi:hypothetical protein